MSDNDAFGFAKLVPGFDFLQNLAKNASQTLPQMSHLSNWVAPTLNVEELEKRIGELKAVQFWLDQNGKALSATIQALEVQKMTLSTLQGMNVKMGEVAEAMKVKPAAAKAAASAAQPEQEPQAGAKKATQGKAAGGPSGAAPIDPLQWWGALTQQFQEIASNAMKDVAQNGALEPARKMAGDAANQAMKTANDMAQAASGMMASGAGRAAAPRKAAGRKTAARKSPARKKPARS